MIKRKFNFSPGPAVLPLEVLEAVRENILSYQGTGIGVMEMSHRSPEFEAIISEAEALFRLLLDVNNDYSVIFTTGGATNQFSMVPLNLLRKGQVADYLITGLWAEKAFAEAKKFGEVHIAASSKDSNYSYIPKELKLSSEPAYLHFTSNNTIYGTQFHSEPGVGEPGVGKPGAGGCPLICDASSDFLSKPIDITRYALVYAGAQKNFGPAGVTVVVIRKDLLLRIPPGLPIMLDYNTYVKERSLYNTPPTFPIYVVVEVLKWIKGQGGLTGIQRHNQEKAALIYAAIDRSDCYVPVAEEKSRSLMNITFRLKDSSLEQEFLKKASEHDLVELKGHRSVGGMRASIYNAFPIEGARTLAGFMDEFARKH